MVLFEVSGSLGNLSTFHTRLKTREIAEGTVVSNSEMY